MPEEKKNEVTEEVKEEVRKLTEEELKKVNGGVTMHSREPGGGYVTANKIHGVEDEAAIPPCR